MKSYWFRFLALALVTGILLTGVACGRQPSSQTSSHDEEATSMTTASLFSETEETTSPVSTVSVSETTTSASSASTTFASTTSVTPNSTTALKTTKAATTKSKATTPTGRKPGEPLELALNDPAIKYMGRTKATETLAFLDWSASYIDLNVKGGRVRMQISASDLNDVNCVYMGVYVNGERTDTIRLSGIGTWYTLAENLPANTVSNVRLVRLNEAAMGTATVQGIEITGTLAARTPDAKHRIEWIGDSITAGYGILAKQSDPFTSATEDATKTYAALVSESMDAEYHILAASGFGVATSNGGSTTDGLLPKWYPYVSIPRGTLKIYQWDYRQFEPELIVVNLGTNDYAGAGAGGGVAAASARLKSGIADFLTTLRAAHPRAKIVWAYGFMIEGFSNEIQTAVEAFARTDGNTQFLKLPLQSAVNGYGSGGHPSAASHLRLAATLSAQLETIMGW